MKIHTEIEGFIIRDAGKKDCGLILSFIKELADYEKLLHEVEATEETLAHSLFSTEPCAKAIIGEFEGRPVGYALFFTNFSISIDLSFVGIIIKLFSRNIKF